MFVRQSTRLVVILFSLLAYPTIRGTVSITIVSCLVSFVTSTSGTPFKRSAKLWKMKVLAVGGIAVLGGVNGVRRANGGGALRLKVEKAESFTGVSFDCTVCAP